MVVATYRANLDHPARSAAVVTPSDTDDLTNEAVKGLHIGGAGNVKVDMKDSGTVTFSGVPAGTRLNIHVTRVYSTGTTGTDILALW